MPWLSCRLKIAAFSSLPAFHRSNSDAIFLFLFFFPSSRNNCSRKHGWHVEQIFALALHCFCMTRPEAWQLGPVIVFDGLRTTSSRVCWGGRKNFFFFLKAEEDYFLLVWNRRGLTDRSAACLLLFFLFFFFLRDFECITHGANNTILSRCFVGDNNSTGANIDTDYNTCWCG